MTPVTPVLPSQPQFAEVIYAKDQPEYRPLPAVVLSDGNVISRWRLNWKERLWVLFRGDIYLQQLTFNDPLQPQLPSVREPEVVVAHG